MNILQLGIIQYPKKTSLSEMVFNEYFKKVNINAIYEGINIHPNIFDNEIKGILEKYYGLNITIPFKERIFKYLDYANESAVFLEAINTIHNNMGYNTDWIGFYNSINEKLDGNILVFGAGGAAKAVLYGLHKLGVDKLCLVNRTYEKAIELKKLFFKKLDIKVIEYEKLNSEIKNANIFINTTSLGMFNEKIPVKLHNNISLVYDVVYFHTPLQKEAELLGIKTINGKEMWYQQAIQNLKIWNMYDEKIFKQVFNSIIL
ncbi:shikimate dehydrogenase [Marinitoga sp. 38H-ov]|nr:shikimate dehydrogenase [Marinitoga sp. 38H-ov]